MNILIHILNEYTRKLLRFLHYKHTFILRKAEVIINYSIIHGATNASVAPVNNWANIRIKLFVAIMFYKSKNIAVVFYFIITTYSLGYHLRLSPFIQTKEN